jgi:hypothetical protein
MLVAVVGDVERVLAVLVAMAVVVLVRLIQLLAVEQQTPVVVAADVEKPSKADQVVLAW